MNEWSDEKILAQLSDDRSFEKAFEALVIKYQEKLYWHIRRLVHFHEDADDVIQNTFIKVFKNIKSFRSDSKLYTWLYRIASNEAITFLNKKKKKASQSLDDEISHLAERLRSDEFFDGDQAQLLLAKAIEFLPERQKLVFNMRYYDELAYDDMSEILQVSSGALKASYHHAVKKVENYLKLNADYV
jgi:RNA polymerase sigma-70 factor (ECF subfamily)